jgi:hypothetical protein
VRRSSVGSRRDNRAHCRGRGCRHSGGRGRDSPGRPRRARAPSQQRVQPSAIVASTRSRCCFERHVAVGSRPPRRARCGPRARPATICAPMPSPRTRFTRSSGSPGPDSPELAVLLNERGILGKYLGRFADSHRLLTERALAIRERHGEEPAVSGRDPAQPGRARPRARRLQTAYGYARRGAGRARRRLPSPDPLALAQDRAALAAILVDLQPLCRGRDLLIERLASYESWLRSPHYEVGVTLHNLVACGTGATNSGRPPTLRRAYHVKRAVLGSPPPPRPRPCHHTHVCPGALRPPAPRPAAPRLPCCAWPSTSSTEVVSPDQPTLLACRPRAHTSCIGPAVRCRCPAGVPGPVWIVEATTVRHLNSIVVSHPPRHAAMLPRRSWFGRRIRRPGAGSRTPRSYDFTFPIQPAVACRSARLLFHRLLQQACAHRVHTHSAGLVATPHLGNRTGDATVWRVYAPSDCEFRKRAEGFQTDGLRAAELVGRVRVGGAPRHGRGAVVLRDSEKDARSGSSENDGLDTNHPLGNQHPPPKGTYGAFFLARRGD